MTLTVRDAPLPQVAAAPMSSVVRFGAPVRVRSESGDETLDRHHSQLQRQSLNHQPLAIDPGVLFFGVKVPAGQLDQDNEFVTDRMPYPYMEMNPKDMDDLKLKAGDLVEVYNDNGSTQAMVYPAPSAKQKQTFMIFAQPTGMQGTWSHPG
jgi:transcription elongation GreA/GreB family factor